MCLPFPCLNLLTRISIMSLSYLNDFHIFFQCDLSLAVQLRISQLPAESLHQNVLCASPSTEAKITHTFIFFACLHQLLSKLLHFWGWLPFLIQRLETLTSSLISHAYINYPSPANLQNVSCSPPFAICALCFLFGDNRILNHYRKNAAVVSWLNLKVHPPVCPSSPHNVVFLPSRQSLSAAPSFS